MVVREQCDVSVNIFLAEACARNVSIDLHYSDRQGQSQTARARLLGCSDGTILIDRPWHNSKPCDLRGRQQVFGCFALCGRRYRFTTRVKSGHTEVCINKRKRITGISLDMPMGLEEQQRRRYYRVLVAGQYSVNVALVQADPNDACACPVGAYRLQGHLVDISAEGLGFSTDLQALAPLSVMDRCFVSFQLPGDDSPLNLYAEARHIRKIPVMGLGRVGLGVLKWDGSNVRRDTRRILDFAISEERRLLARQRR